MRDEILSLLGLARRAGKVEAGFKAAAGSAREKKAWLLLATRDISEKTFKNLKYEGDRVQIPTVRLEASIDEAGKACGVKAGVLAVTDRGFAKAILTKLTLPGKPEHRAEEKEERSI